MLSSKATRKKNWTKKSKKRFCKELSEPESGVYHLQIRSIYGYIRSYTVRKKFYTLG